jgi:hypothetical protein
LLFAATHVECRECLSDKLRWPGNNHSNEDSATVMFILAASVR